MKSNQYIKEHLNDIINDYIKKRDCTHKWEENGFGYECSKCGYYTGLNKELTSIIKNEISREKKLERILNESTNL
jgi:Zn ribbon nucleic-acid-binding protein